MELETNFFPKPLEKKVYIESYDPKIYDFTQPLQVLRALYSIENDGFYACKTVWENGELQCDEYASRSISDLYWICKSYLPNLTIFEFARAIYCIHIVNGFLFRFCPDIDKIVTTQHVPCTIYPEDNEKFNPDWVPRKDTHYEDGFSMNKLSDLMSMVDSYPGKLVGLHEVRLPNPKKTKETKLTSSDKIIEEISQEEISIPNVPKKIQTIEGMGMYDNIEVALSDYFALDIEYITNHAGRKVRVGLNRTFWGLYYTISNHINNMNIVDYIQVLRSMIIRGDIQTSVDDNGIWLIDKSLNNPITIGNGYNYERAMRMLSNKFSHGFTFANFVNI